MLNRLPPDFRRGPLDLSSDSNLAEGCARDDLALISLLGRSVSQRNEDYPGYSYSI
jgi:hypothetical protein